MNIPMLYQRQGNVGANLVFALPRFDGGKPCAILASVRLPEHPGDHKDRPYDYPLPRCSLLLRLRLYHHRHVQQEFLQHLGMPPRLFHDDKLCVSVHLSLLPDIGPLQRISE